MNIDTDTHLSPHTHTCKHPPTPPTRYVIFTTSNITPYHIYTTFRIYALLHIGTYTATTKPTVAVLLMSCHPHTNAIHNTSMHIWHVFINSIWSACSTVNTACGSEWGQCFRLLHTNTLTSVVVMHSHTIPLFTRASCRSAPSMYILTECLCVGIMIWHCVRLYTKHQRNCDITLVPVCL